jgi:hypothetical protein
MFAFFYNNPGSDNKPEKIIGLNSRRVGVGRKVLQQEIGIASINK